MRGRDGVVSRGAATVVAFVLTLGGPVGVPDARASTFTVGVERYTAERISDPVGPCSPTTELCGEPVGCLVAALLLVGDVEPWCRVDIHVHVGGTGAPGSTITGTVTLWDNDICRNFGRAPGPCGQARTPYDAEFSATVDGEGRWTAVAGPFTFRSRGTGEACETMQVDVSAGDGAATDELTEHPRICA